MFKPGLVRTHYLMKLETHRGFYVIEYDRATIAEYIEYAIDETNKFIWLYKFLNESITSKKKKRFWHINLFSKREFLEIGNEKLNELLTKINETRFFVPKQRPQAESEFKPSFESTIVFLAEKLCVPPHVLINQYTLEQAILYSRGIEYNANMATPEGQAKNRFLDAWNDWGDSVDDDIEIVKQMRANKASSSKT